MEKGYKGISFPFRIGNRGGLVLSSTSRYEVPHIIESISQILQTNLKERVMELNFGSNLDTIIFEPNDVATQNILKYEIVETLTRQERRIKVTEKDIVISQDGSKLYATIDFLVLDYLSKYTTKVRIGGGVDGQ